MKKKLLRIFSSVLCLCMLTTACGGGTEDAGNGDDGGEAKDTLTIAVQADMADKDPINGSSTNDTLKIKANVYETLIERTVPEGEYKPLLAESWEFNDDATELTMTLREGVMCHNGEPLTAEDCLFSLRCLRESSNTSVTDHMDLENSYAVDERTFVIVIFQDPYASLNPRMSIGDIIAEPLKIYKLCNSKEEQQKKVREIMDVVGLAERTYGLYPHELDGGRRQRVGIARALILDPKLVVCDEPVSALDVSIQAQILNLMMELQKERNLTYLFITHNLSVVKHISDDITVMYLGQMVEKAGSAEIFAHQYHPYTKALISAIPLPKYNAPDNQIILKGEITSPINVTKSCRFAPRCVYAKPECFENEPQLEEIEKDHFVKCHFVREINGL